MNVLALQSELRALWALTWYPLIAMMRNVATFAFGFIFPVVFIAVFGLIGGGGSGLRLGITPADGTSVVALALERVPGINLIQSDPRELERQLRLGKLEGIVAVRGAQIELQINTASPQSQVATLWLRGVLDQLNLQAAGVSSPSYTLAVAEVAGRRDRYIDFALPGQIGFALLSTAIFGTVFGLLYLKKSLVLKRLFATPVHGATILVGQGLARLVVAILQSIVILALGVLVFGFQLANGWVTFLSMVLLSGLGLIVFLGFGLVIAGLANDENGASPLTNLVTLPQFLLSGVFFSADVFPPWLRVIAEALPLSHFNGAMRQLATEGVGFVELLPSLLILCLWGIGAYVIAARTFKWV